MTVADLIDILSDFDEDAEVRLAIQPSYPFEHRLDDFVAEADGKVYLAEAGQVGYLSGEARAELGW